VNVVTLTPGQRRFRSVVVISGKNKLRCQSKGVAMSFRRTQAFVVRREFREIWVRSGSNKLAKESREGSRTGCQYR
jgi:hypothetical protein